jgi:hypothetical protein
MGRLPQQPPARPGALRDSWRHEYTRENGGKNAVDYTVKCRITRKGTAAGSIKIAVTGAGPDGTT